MIRLGSGLGQDAAWMTYAYVVSLLLQAVYFVVVARSLRAGGFGTFAAGTALVSIAAPFAGLGSGNVLVMRGARDRGEYAKGLGSALTLLAGTGLALLLVVLAVGHLFFGGSPIESVILPLALSELFFARLVDLSSQCFQARDRLRWTAQLTLSTSALRVIAVVLFATLVASPSPDLWSYYYLGASATAGVGALSLTLAVLGRPLFDVRGLRDSVSLGFFFSLGQASKTVYGDIDKVMLARLTSVNVAGFYTAGYRVLTLAFAPIRALVFASNTRLYRAGLEGPLTVWMLVRRLAAPVIVYAVISGAALALLAPLMPLVLGHTYIEAVNVVRLLAVMPLIQGIHYLVGDALMGLDRQSSRSLLQIGTAVLNVLLNLWWIPRLSWTGAVLATIVAEGCLAIASAAMLHRLVARARRDMVLRT